MTTKLFSELGLSPELQKAIDRLGFEQASPIQAEAIPVLMKGLDVVGQSQTGSGKTLAFAGPAIEKVDPLLKAVQVLILCPTRELAVQVSEEVHKLAFFKRGIHALPIYGGQSYERQFLGLRQGAQIVIGTPGRVMDHMRRGTLRLETAKMVILDEADVMLNMGFRDDIEFILQSVPATRQTVFFSATMPRPIQDLIQKYARDPQSVRVEQKAVTVPTVEQFYYEVDRRFKIELLTRLIDLHDLKLGIVFCNTKRMVDDLVDHLNAQGYSADRLHGDMSQGMRDRVMMKFRKSGLEFLVATDVAARGIDVDDVEVVFNYDLPYDAEDYVHRIGRTGRAGRHGRAISFVAGRELFQIQQIERYTRTKIHRARVPTAGEVEEARANQFIDRLRATLQSGEFERQDHLVERLLEEGFTSTDIVSALLHQMQGGEGQTAAKPDRTDRPERSQPAAERPTFQDHRAGNRPERPERLRPPAALGTAAARQPLPSSHSAPVPRAATPASTSTPVESAPVTAASETAATVADESVATPVDAPPSATLEATPAVASESTPSEPVLKPKVFKPATAPGAPKPAAARPPLKQPFAAHSDRPDRPARPERPVRPDRPEHPWAPAGAAERPYQRRPGPFERTDRPRPAERPERANPYERPARPEKAGYTVDRPARPDRPLPKGFPERRSLPLPQARPPKVSRRTPEEQTRIHMNVGEEMGVGPGDIVGAILGETGLPANVVGTVDIRERHLFVDVATEHASGIMAKLNRTLIRGRRVKVKAAQAETPPTTASEASA